MERIIKGMLHHRFSKHDKWEPFTVEELTFAYKIVTRMYKEEKQKVEQLSNKLKRIKEISK